MTRCVKGHFMSGDICLGCIVKPGPKAAVVETDRWKSSPGAQLLRDIEEAQRSLSPERWDNKHASRT